MWGADDGSTMALYHVQASQSMTPPAPRAVEVESAITLNFHPECIPCPECDTKIAGLSQRAEQAEAEGANLRTALAALAEALKEILASGVEFDDERLGYVTMQVSRSAIEDATQLLTTHAAAIPKGAK